MMNFQVNHICVYMYTINDFVHKESSTTDISKDGSRKIIESSQSAHNLDNPTRHNNFELKFESASS